MLKPCVSETCTNLSVVEMTSGICSRSVAGLWDQACMEPWGSRVVALGARRGHSVAHCAVPAFLHIQFSHNKN